MKDSGWRIRFMDEEHCRTERGLNMKEIFAMASGENTIVFILFCSEMIIFYSYDC